MGEEILASYLYQVNLYQWLEANGFGSALTTAVYDEGIDSSSKLPDTISARHNDPFTDAKIAPPDFRGNSKSFC